MPKAGRVIVHGFCDASENAYGACIYIQWKGDTSDEISVGLLCSKAKVAPLKKQSIPRLELCSALLLSKLIVNVKQAIQVKVVETHAWCDSMVVLYWIRGDASRWKSFVSNRVTEIVDNLPAANWRHVKSAENPADLLSRGATPVKIRDNRLWWYGPKWLSESLRPAHGEELHPNVLESDMADAEIEAKGRSRLCHLNVQQFSPNESLHRLIQDCSTLTKIERSLAYCLRFLHNCRKEPRDRLRTRLTLQEINESRRMIIKYTQSFYFQEELGNLQGQGQMKASNKLYQLHPFLDENGILRVGGRLQEAPWTFERKYPILLPAKCKITRLIVERAHRLLLHANQQLLLASIRQQYWPLNARNIVRQVCRTCVWCVRNNPKGLTQAMGHLPSDRIIACILCNRNRLRWSHYHSTQQRSRQKNMQIVCGFVRLLRHKGDTFGGTNDTLLELGIEWSFIPPYSPHLGGLWEAGVKACKYHLKRVMGNNLLTFEELSTVLIQIEACLNSRPLAPLSADPLDLQPLTPSHFLTGAPLTSIPEVDLSNVRINRLDRWEAVQRTVQDFWKRNSTLSVELVGNGVSLGETGIEITDESDVDGGVSEKICKVKAFENVGESGIETGDGEENAVDPLVPAELVMMKMVDERPQQGLLDSESCSHSLDISRMPHPEIYALSNKLDSEVNFCTGGLVLECGTIFVRYVKLRFAENIKEKGDLLFWWLCLLIVWWPCLLEMIVSPISVGLSEDL
ncbi:PREDICTED: uncharacterized protein LOC108769525 [Trachymyrmex cornetzi]|uniref:uncharacterized protein LOC108769525 n=1 Tax=Trachymyrmex cornetzi TaxID=471704 RepID=UPI00084F7D0D|nr:PREDICTED: uncharacterized protein LOC108769525 [Trachymyrmex cornetzi]